MLQPCADQVVVPDPLHSHWIAGDEKSNDETAARKLAQLLRAGLIHPVHHSGERRTTTSSVAPSGAGLALSTVKPSARLSVTHTSPARHPGVTVTW